MALTRRQRDWYFLYQQLRNRKLRSPVVIDTSEKRIIPYGDSIARASTKNSLDPERWVTGVTRANPGIASKAGHLMSAGPAFFHSFLGMTELNETYNTITVPDANTFGVGVDTTNFGAWTADGYVIQERGAVITHLAQGLTSPLNMLTGQRYTMHPRFNRGFSGETTALLDLRKEVSLPASLVRPGDIVNYMGLTNDIITTPSTSSRTNAQIMASLMSIIVYVCDVRQAYFALDDCPPCNDNTPAQKDQRVALNALLDTINHPMVIRVRDYDSLTDPATRNWRNSHDGVHPGPWAGVTKAVIKAATLNTFFGKGLWVLNPNNMLLNPDLAGSSGALSGVLAVNNGIANNWVGTGVGTGAQNTRTFSKGPTGAQQMNANFGSGLTTGERLHLSQTIANPVPGLKYVAECELTIDSFSGTGQWFEFNQELRNQSSAFSTDNHRRNQDAMNIPELLNFCAAGNRLHLKTLEVECLPGWTSVQSRINMSFNCVNGNAVAQMSAHRGQLYPKL